MALEELLNGSERAHNGSRGPLDGFQMAPEELPKACWIGLHYFLQLEQ